MPEPIERLPFELERLLVAASNNQLTFSIRGITDINRYTMAWGVAYLVGDKQEALKVLEKLNDKRNEVNKT